ncbi:MAG: hypothetical protein K2J36_09770 [Ruminococcus sp.]|nr:hypothetical protein [Ruminococcus sp.]
MNVEKIESLEQLSGDQRELAEIIGLDAYRKLVENYGGMCVYIYKLETILRERRNAEIFNEFDGMNYLDNELENCKRNIAQIKEDYITKEDFFREQNKNRRKLDRIMDILLEVKGEIGNG